MKTLKEWILENIPKKDIEDLSWQHLKRGMSVLLYWSYNIGDLYNMFHGEIWATITELSKGSCQTPLQFIESINGIPIYDHAEFTDVMVLVAAKYEAQKIVKEMVQKEAKMEIEKNKYLDGRLENPADVVREQANDKSIWFVPKTLPEHYLQTALRRLHAAFEGERWNSKSNISFKK